MTLRLRRAVAPPTLTPRSHRLPYTQYAAGAQGFSVEESCGEPVEGLPCLGPGVDADVSQPAPPSPSPTVPASSPSPQQGPCASPAPKGGAGGGRILVSPHTQQEISAIIKCHFLCPLFSVLWCFSGAGLSEPDPGRRGLSLRPGHPATLAAAGMLAVGELPWQTAAGRAVCVCVCARL